MSSLNKVDIVASFQISYFISGIAHFGDSLVILAYIPVEEDGEKDFSSTIPSRQGSLKKIAELYGSNSSLDVVQEYRSNCGVELVTEKAFLYSPRAASGGFGSPVYVPTEEPLQLPPIVEGKSPIVQTKDGSFLRSMNPLLFRNANNGARLIVQVSAPVVLPSAMGSMILKMLRCWARVGVEKMCFQANELMPLEDVTGKTIQEVLADAELGLDASNRWDMQQKSDDGEKKTAEYQPYDRSSATLYSCSNAEQIDSDYVSNLLV